MNTQHCIPMLKALADDTRWRIVRELLVEPLTVSQLTERLHVSQYNVSKHVRILGEARIVQKRRIGKLVQCEVTPAFQHRLAKNKNQLNLGCCTFRFDKLPK